MINLASLQSLLLIAVANNQQIGTATGFVIQRQGRTFLATNWHVVSGRRPDTGQPCHPSGALPTGLMVVHNTEPADGDGLAWQSRTESLFDGDDRPRWLEHPEHGRRVDMVLLPLTNLDGVTLHPHEVPASLDVALGVAEPVSIIGFPFGITGGGALAIWTRGAVASEPAVNFDDRPCFLVDSRTRPGQSGSPVVFYSTGPVPMANGATALFSGGVLRLLGVYSGRINSESDLGFVWRTELLEEIAETGVPGNGGLKP